MTRLTLLLALSACGWITQGELEDRQDADQDGFVAEQFGGADCDDTDPLVHPEQQDVPYDGVDSDCDGWSDYDKDRDGADAEAHGGQDCDDEDEEVGPDADEVWYDGVDQDCDGADDFDQDADGHDDDGHGGDDCDDTDPDVHPGAAEDPLDQIDQNCNGSLLTEGTRSGPHLGTAVLQDRDTPS